MSPSYALHRARLHELPGHLERWRARFEAQSPRLVYRDPGWVTELYRHPQAKVTREDLHVYFLEQDGALAGVWPLVLVRWPLECLFGEITWARLPMRRLCPPFSDADLPGDPRALDTVFEALARGAGADYDVLFFEDLLLDSTLWRYLHESPLVRRSFVLYAPEPPREHSFIDMGSSFDDYLGKFSAKTRSTLRRKVNKLRRQGELTMTRVTEADQVAAFARGAASVSRRSYQFTLFGTGIRRPDAFARELAAIARLGWLRCYLLELDGRPCSFMIGYQDERAFYYIDVAFDQAFNRLSVGTVLQYLVLEDLYRHRTPALFDFCGGHGEHKVFFENRHVLGTDVFLFPRRPYPRLAQLLFQGSVHATRQVSDLLDRHDLKARVKRGVRRASVLLGRSRDGR